MALTNEDLLAISQLLDTKLDAKLKPIEKNIQSLTQDVSSIKLEIENTINEYNISKIVLGFPKNMNNTRGPKGELSLMFRERLAGIISVPVYLQDERLSTKSATDILIEGNVSRKKRKKIVDSMAATIILQTYLDGRKDV